MSLSMSARYNSPSLALAGCCCSAHGGCAVEIIALGIVCGLLVPYCVCCVEYYAERLPTCLIAGAPARRSCVKD